MKTIFKKIVIRSLTFLLAVGFLYLASSCRSDDKEDKQYDKNTYKITLTLNGVDTDDYVSFSLAGTNTNADSNVWKLNGQTQAGQIGISLGKDNFTGSTKTYVIESNFKITGIAAGGQIINVAPGAITGTLKIEKNGTVQVNENINLATDMAQFSKQYNL